MEAIEKAMEYRYIPSMIANWIITIRAIKGKYMTLDSEH